MDSSTQQSNEKTPKPTSVRLHIGGPQQVSPYSLSVKQKHQAAQTPSVEARTNFLLAHDCRPQMPDTSLTMNANDVSEWIAVEYRVSNRAHASKHLSKTKEHGHLLKDSQKTLPVTQVSITDYPSVSSLSFESVLEELKQEQLMSASSISESPPSSLETAHAAKNLVEQDGEPAPPNTIECSHSAPLSYSASLGTSIPTSKLLNTSYELLSPPSHLPPLSHSLLGMT